MSRRILGQRMKSVTRTFKAPTGPTTAADGKLDVHPTIAKLDLGAEPITGELQVPAYDAVTYNQLEKVEIVFVPAGATEPATADAFASAGFPMATVTVAPSTATPTATPTSAPVVATTPTTVAAAPAATPSVVAPVTVAPVTVAPVTVAAAPVTVGTVATPAAPTVLTPAHVAVSATATAKAAQAVSTFLPGPAGGLVSFSIANVPDGMFEVQLLLTYDA